MTMRAVATAVALLFWTAAPTSALEFGLHPNNSETENAISASGSIVPGDAFAFQAYLTTLPQKPIVSIYLNSPGGSVQSSMELGRIIYKLKIRTYVVGDKVRCSSACTKVFIAGRDRETDKPFRVKSTDAQLRFHNFTPVLEDKVFAKADAVAMDERAQKTILTLALYLYEVGSNLEYLGYGLKSEKMITMSNSDALANGIDILDTKTGKITKAAAYQQSQPKP